MKNHYLEANQEAVEALFRRNIQGEIVMLNLLRFRQISGVEAFQKYIDHTLPILQKTGGDITFLGEGGHFLIGPQEERWDFVMLIRQNSLADFLSFSSNHEYLKGLGHRTAAIEDSRLLPLVETTSAS